jgi:hypothetical protein
LKSHNKRRIIMAGRVRRYNMFPQKTFAGHVETEVLKDGRIKYTLFPVPFDGEEPRTFILDPASESDMRAAKQLHLVEQMPLEKDPHSGGYIITDSKIVDQFFDLFKKG